MSKGLTEEQQIQRIATNFRLWMRQVSHPMQEELFRRARLLQANIILSEWRGREIEIVTDSSSKSVLLHDRLNGNLIRLLSYRLSGPRLFLANLKRTMRYTYYCGGGREAWNFLPQLPPLTADPLLASSGRCSCGHLPFVVSSPSRTRRRSSSLRASA